MAQDLDGAYMDEVVRVLAAHRPELLEPRRGRWTGPFAPPPVAGLAFRGPGLAVVVSPWDTSDELWLHVSLSRAACDPSYADLSEVRLRFFRPTDTVLHVWPPVAEHYNLHPYCLHLWTPMDGSRPIPDLRGQGGGV